MMALPNRKLVTGFFLMVFISTGILATRPPDEEEHYTNLKILSKKITDEEMDRIMHRFNAQLGVTCMYCHVHKKNVPYPLPNDFASDEKKEKIIARQMLTMTIKLNRKYFDIKMDSKLEIKPRIWCITCHKGIPVPQNVVYPR